MLFRQKSMGLGRSFFYPHWDCSTHTWKCAFEALDWNLSALEILHILEMGVCAWD